MTTAERDLLVLALDTLATAPAKWGEGQEFCRDRRHRIATLRAKLAQPPAPKYCCFNRDCWNPEYFEQPACPRCDQPGVKQRQSAGITL